MVSTLLFTLSMLILSSHSKPKCTFGHHPRSIDTLKTSDCSCQNSNVQFKFTQIAADATFHVGILSANRNDDDLRVSGTKKVITFYENFCSDDYHHATSLAGPDGPEWDGLDEFLYDGNDEGDASFIDLVLDDTDTLIFTTPSWIIKDCSRKKVDGEWVEIATMVDLEHFYRRPVDDDDADVIQRTYGMTQFTRKEDANVWLITRQSFEGTLFSMENGKRRGDYTKFSTFDTRKGQKKRKTKPKKKGAKDKRKESKDSSEKHKWIR